MSSVLTLNGGVLVSNGVAVSHEGSGGGGYFTVTDTTDTAGGTIRTIMPTEGTPVVQSGKSITITENGTTTITPDVGMTAMSNLILTANVAGRGYTLIGGAEYTVNTTSTSATNIGTISCGSLAVTAAKIIYVKVRDKVGPRTGYFFGSDSFIWLRAIPSGESTFTQTAFPKVAHYVDSSGDYRVDTTASGRGVYAYSLDSDGDVVIRSLYNSTIGTINGTFSVEVYLLDYAPNGNPYNYTYPSSDIISFSIGDSTYSALQGMTWSEWMNSEYNTAGDAIEVDGTSVWYYDPNLISYLIYDSVVDDPDLDEYVHTYQIIVPNRVYGLYAA